MHNIQDVLAAAMSLQERRNHDKSKTGTIVFFDLTKANDMVDRDILIQKLLSFSKPFNIICTIKEMLDKFTLTFKGQHIKTERGLVQGSVLSPILFNLYINDLMWELELENIKSWAYADVLHESKNLQIKRDKL